MSIKLMSRVWECQLDHSHQGILLALADYGEDDGTNIYPSIEHLAWKSGYSPRQTQRIVRELINKKVLIPVDTLTGGRGTTTEFQMDLSDLQQKTAFRPEGRIGPTKRALVVAAFENTCQYCKGVGTEVNGPDGDLWSIDRLVPAKKGGRYDDDNITLACQSCNRSKGAKMAPLLKTERVSSYAEKGVISDHKGCQIALPNKEEPSRTIEPSVCGDLPKVIEGAFKYYLKKTGRDGKQYTFTKLRKEKGLARLREAMQLAGGDLVKAKTFIKLAIDHLVASDFHMSGNYYEWEKHLFPSREKFEFWLNRNVKPLGVGKPDGVSAIDRHRKQMAGDFS